jgi:hypothetical protein
MDDLFRVPVLGWRFGLDALIGLIPGLGDTTTSLVSFYILVAAVRYRVPKITLLRMGFNIAIDYVVGSLPFVGDLADAWWKSNHMNVELLRRRATVSGEEAHSARMSDWIFVGGIIVGLTALAIASASLVLSLEQVVDRIRTGLQIHPVSSCHSLNAVLSISRPRSPAAKLLNFPSASNK